MLHDEAKALIARQFEDGVIERPAAHALRDHLRVCDDCKAHYNHHVDLESALHRERERARLNRLMQLGLPSSSRVVEGADQVIRELEKPVSLELHAAPQAAPAPALGLAAREDRAGPATATWRPFRIATGLAVAAAVLFSIATLLRPPAVDDGFTPRGTKGVTGRHAWVQMFERSKEGTHALGPTLSRGDGLLFAYTNLGGSGYSHLLIAGRDSAGRVHWYHPAYQDAAEDPRSITIAGEAVSEELPELISADHALGSLEICAVFTPEPLRVKDVDATLEATGEWPSTGEKDCRRVEVTE